jgi:hypothetical protein
MSATHLASPFNGVPLYPTSDSHGGHRLKSPIYVLSVFVAALKQYFGTSNRIAIDYSNYKWEKDQSVSNVWISEEFSMDRSVIGKRPSILVSINGTNYPQQTLGDFSHFDPTNSTSYMINVMESALNFRCVSENMLSSLELATEVKYFLSTFCHQISGYFCLEKFRPTQMSKTQKIEEYKEFFVTDLLCELKYKEILGIEIESLRVKTVFSDLVLDNKIKDILFESKI